MQQGFLGFQGPRDECWVPGLDFVPSGWYHKVVRPVEKSHGCKWTLGCRWEQGREPGR